MTAMWAAPSHASRGDPCVPASRSSSPLLLVALALPAAVGARARRDPQSERARTLAYWTPATDRQRDPTRLRQGRLRQAGSQGQAGWRRQRHRRGHGRLVDRQRDRREAVGPDPVHDGRLGLHLLRFGRGLRQQRHVLDGPERRSLRLRRCRWLGDQLDVHPRLRRCTDLHLQRHDLRLLDREPARGTHELRQRRWLQRPGRRGRLRVRTGRARRQGRDRDARSRCGHRRLRPQDERRDHRDQAVGLRLSGRRQVQGQGPDVLHRDAGQRPERREHLGHGLQHDRRLVRRSVAGRHDEPGHDRRRGRVAQLVRLRQLGRHVRAQVHVPDQHAGRRRDGRVGDERRLGR